MKKLSPLEVMILLHYWSTPTDFRDMDAPAIKAACEKFERIGILKRGDGDAIYVSNDSAMKVYIDAVCSVQLPVIKKIWIVPGN